MNNSLKGARVLVTRPQQQADNLSRLLIERGGQAIRMPTLAITAVEDIAKIKNTLATLEKFQWLVFISANAVNFAVQANDGKIIGFSGIVAAIGQSTAAALQQAGLTVGLIPPPPYNSEALLETKLMQQVNGQRILIVRGESGRDELANILQDRGAQVEYLDVYRRVVPTVDCSQVNALLAGNGLDVITVTSGEALQNLFIMIDERYHQKLLDLPLVVISNRIKQIAVDKGFKRIAVTNDPADVAILEMVIMSITGGIGWQN